MTLEHDLVSAYWVARSEDFPIAEQGATPQEASQRLRIALREYLTIEAPEKDEQVETNSG